MIKSMTGFGRCEAANETRKVTAEIKSVNHRYLDISIKMPKKLNFFENAIRTSLKSYIQRGKVDIYIAYEDCKEKQLVLNYNKGLAEEYMRYIRQMADDFQIPMDLTANNLSKYPEILTMEGKDLDEEEWWRLLDQAVQGAAQKFVDARIREGEELRQDLFHKLDVISGYLEQIEERSPEIVREYRAKLKEKVQELLENTQLDEGRLLTEVTVFADRICTDEEIVRLKTHISSMKETLTKDESIGRKLDFIAQEMNREANTILSKANDIVERRHTDE